VGCGWGGWVGGGVVVGGGGGGGGGGGCHYHGMACPPDAEGSCR